MFRSAALACLLVSALASCTAGSPAEAHDPPPPVVRDDSTNLVFTYGDASGFHAAEHVADVPEASRAAVRVASVDGSREQGLDPSRVWVVDLRQKGADGRYPVRADTREHFEARARPAPAPPAGASRPAPSANADANVVLYSTSWCGYCRQARAFFQERGVAFVERDIEREPGAREEMLRKASAQGLHPSGVPVIDVHGTIVPGFDRARIASLLSGI